MGTLRTEWNKGQSSERQRWIETPCCSLRPLHTREGQSSRRCHFPFCLDGYKNNFPTLSHLAFLKMRPKSCHKLLRHVGSTHKGKMTLGCPGVVARPRSQAAVTELYYTSWEGSSVSEPQKKLHVVAPVKRWNYFLAQDMCDMFLSTPAATHTHAHSLRFLAGTEQILFYHIP